MSTALVLASCTKEEENNNDSYAVNNPDTAPVVSIDRFSDDAGMLFRRSANSSLPAADQPINFDQGPFITKGLGPGGENVEYYNFDVMPTAAIPIYVLFKEGASEPVAGQLNIIESIPGDVGYSDFWRVNKVTVPSNYEANSASSLADLLERDFTIEAMDLIVNCPVVPRGSTAGKRMGGASTGLVRGWYKDEVVFYFDFSEKMLSSSSGIVPLSPIYVAFNVNPDPNNSNSGPASGFMTEMGTDQTHNVVATIPSDAAYSPLWTVNVYDNADFGDVSDLNSAMSANILANGVATVNCPVVSVQ